MVETVGKSDDPGVSTCGTTDPAVVTTCGQNCIVFTYTADNNPDQPEHRRQFHFVGGQWQTQNEIERGSVTCGDGHRVDVTTSWVINREFTHGQTVGVPATAATGPSRRTR